MAAMNAIPLSEITLPSFTAFDQGWFLVTAGDFASRRFNTMTVSWGFLGTMWSKPVAQVVIRPQRYTREFLDEFDTFTVSAFPASFRKALALLGSKSGRDGDKIAEAGLHPVAATTVAAPTFAEATLTLECRKLFRQEMRDESFRDRSILPQWYPTHDLHIVYIGEVLAATKE